ncbi:hypothetical protein CsSME_00035595 [Camellia sinensis var. sinensis]
MILTKQYRCMHSTSCTCTKGHLTEDAIFLIFQHLNWNPKLIAAFSCACKWFDDVAKRVLWKEFCKARAPKMMLDLQSSGSQSTYLLSWMYQGWLVQQYSYSWPFCL